MEQKKSHLPGLKNSLLKKIFMKHLITILCLTLIFLNSCKNAQLDAEVGTYNESGSLIVTNKSNETWNNLNITIKANKGGGEASYSYFKSKLETGLKLVVEKNDFVNKLGERFPYNSEIYKVTIECDQGRGEWQIK